MHFLWPGLKATRECALCDPVVRVSSSFLRSIRKRIRKFPLFPLATSDSPVYPLETRMGAAVTPEPLRSYGSLSWPETVQSRACIDAVFSAAYIGRQSITHETEQVYTEARSDRYRKKKEGSRPGPKAGGWPKKGGLALVEHLYGARVRRTGGRVVGLGKGQCKIMRQDGDWGFRQKRGIVDSSRQTGSDERRKKGMRWGGGRVGLWRGTNRGGGGINHIM